MENVKLVMDTIRVAVNQSCACSKAAETNVNDVIIAAIIAGCLLAAILVVCYYTYKILRMKKYEGIKAIVDEICEKKEEQNG